MLDNNNPVMLARGLYDNNIRIGGHFIIVYDYHWDSTNNIYLYDIFDPAPVNSGRSYARSYQSICNGRNPAFSTDERDSGIWEGIVVYQVGDYTNTINYPSP